MRESVPQVLSSNFLLKSLPHGLFKLSILHVHTTPQKDCSYNIHMSILFYWYNEPRNWIFVTASKWYLILIDDMMPRSGVISLDLGIESFPPSKKCVFALKARAHRWKVRVMPRSSMSLTLPRKDFFNQ